MHRVSRAPQSALGADDQSALRIQTDGAIHSLSRKFDHELGGRPLQRSRRHQIYAIQSSKAIVAIGQWAFPRLKRKIPQKCTISKVEHQACHDYRMGTTARQPTSNMLSTVWAHTYVRAVFRLPSTITAWPHATTIRVYEIIFTHFQCQMHLTTNNVYSSTDQFRMDNRQHALYMHVVQSNKFSSHREIDNQTQLWRDLWG